ncbi:unnamed protein product [Prorocentrum cordatum]|uniref:Protein RFT1 homolog n=1 Tax=Prorocentrum cordatum TaxID=2364126 RepID=A0ABN9WPF7_9DINO|nr:unnamed protein product [Polarella glacialis]
MWQRAAQLRFLGSLLYIRGLLECGLWVAFGLQLVQLDMFGASPFGAVIRGVLLAAGGAAHAASVRFFAAGAFADLERYASGGLFVQTWSSASKRAALALGALLVLMAGAVTLVEGAQWWPRWLRGCR